MKEAQKRGNVGLIFMNGQLREIGMRSLRSNLIVPVPATFDRVTWTFADLTSRTSSGPSIPGLGLNVSRLKRRRRTRTCGVRSRMTTTTTRGNELVIQSSISCIRWVSSSNNNNRGIGKRIHMAMLC